MRVKIKVTKNDIKTGQPDNVHACPIALAIRKTLRACKIYSLTVSSDIAISNEDSYYETSIRMPMKAHIFIKRFDAGLQVKPFDFCVDISKHFLNWYKNEN